MIDVGVWPGLSPGFAGWVGIEVLHHVLVHELLQIETQRVAGCADHNIGAYPCAFEAHHRPDTEWMPTQDRSWW